MGLGQNKAKQLTMKITHVTRLKNGQDKAQSQYIYNVFTVVDWSSTRTMNLAHRIYIIYTVMNHHAVAVNALSIIDNQNSTIKSSKLFKIQQANYEIKTTHSHMRIYR